MKEIGKNWEKNDEIFLNYTLSRFCFFYFFFNCAGMPPILGYTGKT